MIYITGANGFIGKHLTIKLKEEGIPWVSMPRKKKNRTWLDFEIQADSTCIHLAGQSEINLFMDNTDNLIKETKDLALDLIKMNFSQILFASSGLVYGDKSTEPHLEDETVTADHPYALAKLEAEKIFLNEGCVVVRLANVYGLGMSLNNILSDILKQIPGNDKSVVIRDGSSIRDFIHVKDVVSGFAKLAMVGAAGIYNLGSGIGVKARDLARLALDLSGLKEMQIESLKKENSNSCIVLDNSKLSSACSWSPEISLEDGMRDVLLNR